MEKFHKGECTLEEIAILESWYNDLDDQSSERLSTSETAHYRELFLKNFAAQLPTQRTVRSFSITYKWLAAACVLLLIGAGMVWMYSNEQPAGQAPVDKVFTISNETDHIRQVRLTDSSLVWLNARASLSWKENFNKEQRSISLQGEAFFDVHHDPTRPFIIHTRDLDVRVLGTAFNVEAYPTEKTTRVSLLRGSVNVRLASNKMVQTTIQPGYAAYYSGKDKIDTGKVETGTVAAWKNGGFSVNDLSWQEAVTRLCTRYGYTVQWNDNDDLQKRISVVFDNAGFGQSLRNLCYMAHKQFRIKDHQVSIY